MTDSTAPEKSKVFLVGKNQAKTFPVARLRGHDQHMDALFNRNGESCRSLYDQLYPQPSPTRGNIDRLVQRLNADGVTDVLETNVICYSTPMSSDLAQAAHAGGRARGTELFRGLLDLLQPRVLIAHGSGTLDILSRLLGTGGFDIPENAEKASFREVGRIRVYPIPSFAPPAWNKWSRWAGAYFDRLAKSVAEIVGDKSQPVH